MPHVVIVTGTPGTGKTEIAKKVALCLKHKYVDVNKLIRQHKLSEGVDRKRKSKIVDTKKLNKFLVTMIKNAKDDLVIDSHLSHFLSHKSVDLCIVTTCDLKVLQKRLGKRGYSKAKVKENIDAEIFRICLFEAEDRKHNVLLIDTTRRIPNSTLCSLVNT